MEYKDKYPNSKVNEEVEKCITKVESETPCLHCGKLSQFVDLDFEANFCSEECNRAKWQEYEEANEADEDTALLEEGLLDNEDTDIK
jgi:hypothetical protein